MTLLVVGTDCAVARALHDARPVDQVAGAMNELRAHRPDQIALVALPPSVGPIGALAPAAFAELAHDTLTLSLSVVQAAAQLEGPVRIALICPADAIHPDHLDGARSVIGAG
ncbi:MAG: hypothetical protein ACR2J9_04205, partial [Gaiellales bacterium]